MSNFAGSSLYSSANASTSTLRPRNNRLISYLDDTSSDTDTPPQAISTSHSTSTSRGASPATLNARSRSGIPQSADQSSKRTFPLNGPEDVGARRSSGLWDSWSSIQGVASSIFGNDNAASTARKGSGTFKTPAWMKQDPRFKITTNQSQWGPDSQDTVTAPSGTIEERRALVQAKKREALLLSCAQEGRDHLGRHKRKGSTNDINARSPTLDLGEDALVYKHTVRAQDTMAGVTIKYSCQPEAFRKLNRFWPNDNIQTRAFVLLPVDACSIRGRKIDDLTGIDLLSKSLKDVELDPADDHFTSPSRRDKASPSPSPVKPLKYQLADEEDFRHDSYVLLPSFDEPVEILRIPRKTVGYFPRARRKSTHLATDTRSSTPRSSFDHLRHPPTHAAQQAIAAAQQQHQQPAALSLNGSPVRRPRLSSHNRQHSNSTTNTTTTNSNTAWILRGPGGVGSLRGLRTELSRPGPAEDPLNQKFAKYLPDLNRPETPEDTGSLLTPPQISRITASHSPYRSTPRASMDSIRSSRSNSSTFGAGVAGVENFMRKLAPGSSKNRPDHPRRSNSGNINSLMSLGGGGGGDGSENGLGDLIELETTTPTPETGQWTDRGRDRNRIVTNNNTNNNNNYDEDEGNEGDLTPTVSNMSQQQTKGKGKAQTMKTDEDLLNERFPVRGRITRAYDGDL